MKKHSKSPITEEELFRAIHQTLRRRGWLVPTNPEDVARAEEHPGVGAPPRPHGSLPDPDSAGGVLSPDCVVRIWGSAPMETPLARAAREGGVLSPEVEAAMKRDRERAEAAWEASDHGTPKDIP
jgi:hypothetical protein